jgi:hypothetical protein
MTFGTQGTERMRITSSGNVGIGTSSPDAQLHLEKDAPEIRLTDTTFGTYYSIGGANVGLTFSYNGSEVMRIRDGKVGIGTSSPASQFHLFSSDPQIRLERSDAQNDATAQVAGNAAGSLLLKADPDNLSATDSIMRFDVDGSERMRILSSGGITFNGDAAAANALDDYEEGTWTPTCNFGGSESSGATYAFRGGTYTKIGRQVTVTGRIDLSNKGTGSGHFGIGGLPFSTPNDQKYRSAVALWISEVSYSGQVSAIVVLDSTQFVFYQTAESGARSNIESSNISNTTDIIFSLTYFV